jgi:hypothetical protein
MRDLIGPVKKSKKSAWGGDWFPKKKAKKSDWGGDWFTKRR